jgi:geranylgeranyl pyrophosphate synthase
MDKYNVSYSHGMLTLLASKCINLLNPSLIEVDQFGILPSQRTLSEITETIRLADLIHGEVVDLNDGHCSSKSNDISFGNKLIILAGDILLSRACKDLALLYKPQIVNLISQAISSISTGRFLSLSSTSADVDNASLSNNLLGMSYRSCSILAGLNGYWQNTLMNFGIHLSILRQISKQNFIHRQEEGSGKGADWYHLYANHSSKALRILDQLPDSDSKTVLEDFIINLTLM